MNEYTFDAQSVEARKARLAVALNRVRRLVLLLLATVVLLSGILLLPVFAPMGAVVIGVGIWLLLILVWYRYELSQLPAQLNSKLEVALSPDIRGRLKNIDSPFALWEAVRFTPQQQFFSVRYGIPVEMFDELVSHDEKLVQDVLAQSVALAERHGLPCITAGSVLAALIRIMPEYEKLLAQLSLSIEDVETGVDWLHHAQQVEERQLGKSSFGGLARDWIGGYTPQLFRLSHNMSEDVEQAGFIHRDLSTHKNEVVLLHGLLSKGSRAAALVGPLGSGKTTIGYSFAQSLLLDSDTPSNLRYNHVLSLDVSSLINEASEPGQLEALLQKVLVEAANAKNTILFFDQASLFFEEGVGSIDLGKILTPVIDKGAVPMIFVLEPPEWQQLKKQYHELALSLNPVIIPEPSPHAMMEILEDQVLLLEAEYGVVYMYQALKESVRLSGSYLRDVAMPGRAIKLLQMSAEQHQESIVTGKSVQVAVERAFGVKVEATTKANKHDLLHLEDRIHERMINQTRAVRAVASALRRAQSGVGRDNRPIGSFLFLGPTGVGKTQLAKTLAATFYGSDETIVRVDMNELAERSDVARLIDVDTPNSLLSQLGRNPFSVVLLDEVEKAHDAVMQALLQALDEGVMLDARNNAVSFRDAIVIATSNAGSDEIRHRIDKGEALSDFEEEFVSNLVDSKQFRPEFLNRFDEVVLFRPLSSEELMQLVDKLLEGINKTLDAKKISVELSTSAKQWLAAEGYDARLGARPLRRMIQRTVENIVARRILESDSLAGTVIKLDVADLESEVRE